MRVVSLLASGTEIVCALGRQDSLVGRSHECDYPLSVRELPRCTEPDFPTGGSSADIDRRVKEKARAALSLYKVDDALLARLKPDVIVTQSQCEVCAVSLKDVEKALAKNLGTSARVVSLEPNSLADVWADFARVAAALGAEKEGRALLGGLEARLAAIAERTRGLPRPAVAYLEWLDPPMAGGNWTPELVEIAGGRNLFGEAGKHSPRLDWDALRKADPDAIVVSPCGFDVARTLQERSVLEAKPGWKDLKAVKAGRVAVADGNQFFNRPGPRLVESAEILAEILHGLRFGHEGTGWVRF